MIKAVFFDLGDTLVKDPEFLREKRNNMISQFLKDSGHEKAVEELKETLEEAIKYVETQYKGSPKKHEKGLFLSVLFKKLGVKVDGAVLNQLDEGFRNIYLKEIKLMPNAEDVILSLKKRGYKLVIVSNALTAEANFIIDKLGLRKHFDLVVISEDVGQEKSTTIPFKIALEKLHLKPEEVIVVGDREDEDILGAKLLGMKAVRIRGPHGPYGETRKADYEIDDLRELKRILPLD